MRITDRGGIISTWRRCKPDIHTYIQRHVTTHTYIQSNTPTPPGTLGEWTNWGCSGGKIPKKNYKEGRGWRKGPSSSGILKATCKISSNHPLPDVLNLFSTISRQPRFYSTSMYYSLIRPWWWSIFLLSLLHLCSWLYSFSISFRPPHFCPSLCGLRVVCHNCIKLFFFT